jgi:histone arginine demethylase JMJD6
MLPSSTFSLDGGPAFARNSMSEGKVSMNEYARYVNNDSDGDVAPLYIFDANALKSNTKSGQFVDGSSFCDAYSIPACFSKDAQEKVTFSAFRPLPPAWLLVGGKGSGTPIHDHPTTAAWNALLSGCKLWACLPPNCSESALLLNSTDDVNNKNNDDVNDEDEECDFDLSALQWFGRCQSKNELPEDAKIIIQQPGEVVYLPPGWWHVVLNIENSTAISHSLALRRDIDSVIPELMQIDENFAKFWISVLDLDDDRKERLLNSSNPSSSSSSPKV